MRKRQLLALSLLAGLLLAPLAATADHHETAPKPVSWLSFSQSQPGKSDELTRHLAEGGAKVYDGLMADGQILSWGVSMAVNHFPGDEWNIMEWVTFRDWAAVDGFMQAFMTHRMSQAPEEAMAEQKRWMELVVPGSHFDEIFRQQVYVVSTDTPPAYLSLGYQTAKPGKGSALTKQYKEWGMPIMQGLFDAGDIGGYGLATPTVHGDNGGTHVMWYSMSGLAARDAVSAAFQSSAAEAGPEAQQKRMESFAEAVKLGKHHDRLFMITHLGGSGGGDSAAE